jgi:hypothetical protein
MTHRRKAVRFFAAGLLIVAAACDRTPVTSSTHTPDPLLQALPRLGLSPAGAVDGGTFYLVEGDIVVEKERLRALLAAEEGVPGPLFQYQKGLVTTTRTVRVSLANLGAQTSWATALREAMTLWNAVPGNGIQFVESTSSPHIVAGTYNPVGGTDRCAGGTTPIACVPALPSGGGPATNIWINLAYSYDPTPPYSVRLFNMVHELGHTIGIMHTNAYSTSCPTSNTSGYSFIPGTQTVDAGSVMNGCTSANYWNGFSFYDQVAVRALYPAPGPTPTGTVVNGYPSLSWAAVPGATEYKVYYSSWLGIGDASPRTLVATTTGTSAYIQTFATSAAQPCYPPTAYYEVRANFPGGPEGGLSIPACFALW